MRLAGFFILLMPVIFPVFGQQISKFHLPRFDHITIDQGLSQNTVNAIFKDSEGYMWFGTNDGLNRFDGYSMEVFRNIPGDTNSLSNGKIFAIAQDLNGDIWIGTANGLNRYDPQKGCFERFYHNEQNKNSLSHNFVRSIYTDDSGIILIGTLGGGLSIYDTKSKIMRKSANIIRSEKGDFVPVSVVSSIIKDKEESILLGADVNAIVYYDILSDKMQAVTFDGGRLVKTNFIGRTLYQDSEGDIWICTEGGGIYLWHKKEREFYSFRKSTSDPRLSGDLAKGIIEISPDLFWIVIDGGGLNILNKKSGEILVHRYDPNNNKSINTNALYTIYVDNQQIIWIGTFDGGINVANPNKKDFLHFTHTNTDYTLSHKAVLCFLEESPDKIWIGTDGGGLNLFDRQKGSFKAFKNNSNNSSSMSSNVITSLLFDHNKQLWVGSYLGGLMKYQGNGNFKIYNSANNPELQSNHIWCMLEDRNRQLWIGTLGGLYLFDRAKEYFQAVRDNNVNNQNHLLRNICLMEDKKGNIWVGGNGIAVYSQETDTWEYYNHDYKNKKSLGVDNVRCIFEDSQENIWIGTEGAGLNKFKAESQSFLKWTTSDGLPNNSIHQILEDDLGNLWISSNKGLSKLAFSGDSLEAITNYDVNDGLQSNQFSYAAAMKSVGGEMYFGGVNGFNVFNPEAIAINPYPPPVKITGFKINQKSNKGGYGLQLLKMNEHTETITLNHAQSRLFSIEYTALNFTAPEKNSFAFRLDGFDQDGEWLQAGNTRTATYTNLNEDTYTFRVKAANNDGVWNEIPATLKIKILPPIWRTWYAYLVYALMIAGITLSMRRFTIERIHLKNDIRLKELERQKNEEINQAKLMFFTSISHEFKTPLTLIIGPLKKLMDDFRDNEEIRFYHSLMYRNAKRLLHLINQLMDFRKIENGNQKIKLQRGDIVEFVQSIMTNFNSLSLQKQIKLNLESNKKEIDMVFDHDIIDKVIYNLLSNAFKFTSAQGRISVKITESDNNLKIAVKDTGTGITKEMLPFVFDRYFHLDQSAKQQYNNETGTGIGLALSYELIRMHHGTIEVSSSPGTGSEFTVSLPTSLEEYNNEEIDNMQPLEFGLRTQVEDYNDGEFFTYEADSWSFSEENDKRPMLLLVEDNAELRAFLKQYLHNQYRVLEAVNGEEGLKKATKYIPDMVISDIMMPVMDGIELCEELKNNVTTNHIPLILLTAKSTDENKIEGLKAGADDYINKPFQVQALELKIKNLIDRQKSMQKKYGDQLFKIAADDLPSAEDRFIADVKSIIENHFSDADFDVNTFAREINMSRSVLYRKFKAVTGQSVNELISDIRLRKAAELLKNKSLSISDVAYAVGFSDPQYFSKCFRKKYNATPTEYAAQTRI